MKKINAYILGALAATATVGTAVAMDHKGMSHTAEVHSMAKAASHNYTAAAFKQAQEAGKHIVVDVWKKGCPTCKAQHPTLEKAKAKYPEAVFFKVDFNEQKDVVRQFNAVTQSTIIVFNGKEEVARSVGETREDALLAQIATGADA